MNPTRRISRRAVFFAVLTLLAPGIPALAAAEPVDPLAGDWLWDHGRLITFRADGTMDAPDLHSTWEYRHNPEAQRHYRLVWERGKSIDNVVLSEDGQRAHVTNYYPSGNKAQYDVKRATPDKPAASPSTGARPAATGAAVTPAAGDPLPGAWRWLNNRPVTFNGDGTCGTPQNPDGIWEFLRNPGAQRHYRVTWEHGKFVDELTLAPDGQHGHVLNTVNPDPAIAGHLEYDISRETVKGSYFGSSPR